PDAAALVADAAALVAGSDVLALSELLPHAASRTLAETAAVRASALRRRRCEWYMVPPIAFAVRDEK
ncbi:MAG: hypothetical protein PSX37_00370, partial [bacterium]|nr:hypothetical protein [bacterium]